MKIVVAPDSYKGSLSSEEICRIVARAVADEFPGAEVVSVPMADGGEGTVAAIASATGGRLVPVTVTGPLGERAEALWAIAGDGRTAILETANTAGLTMVPERRRDPLRATSAGLGEALLAALDAGMRRIVIGLGGSAVNDGGMGFLGALGATFRDAEGKALRGCGGELKNVRSAYFAGLDPRLAECELIAASDVRNPLTGANGATAVFGPQKGVRPEDVPKLDAAMASYADAVELALDVRVRNEPGSGAAGGLGFALRAIGAAVRSGAEIVAEAVGLEEKLRGADWAVTGEGRSDGQTLQGKLPSFVSEAAHRAGVPCLLLSGSIGEPSGELRKRFDGCFSIVNGPADLETCLREAEPNLYRTAGEIMKVIQACARTGKSSGAGSAF